MAAIRGGHRMESHVRLGKDTHTHTLTEREREKKKETVRNCC